MEESIHFRYKRVINSGYHQPLGTCLESRVNSLGLLGVVVKNSKVTEKMQPNASTLQMGKLTPWQVSDCLPESVRDKARRGSLCLEA